MTDLNTLTIHGRIVRNADFTTTDSGLTVSRFALASNKARRTQNGEWVNETTFIPLVLFGKRAECLAPFIRKGRGITVQGHIKQNHWEKDGEKRTELAIVVDNVLFDPVLRKSEETQSLQSKPVNSPVQNPANQAAHAVATVQDRTVQYEEQPFMSDGEFYSESDFDFPPPEITESFEIF